MGKKVGEMTPEELREVSRKGGQASVKARKERRERTKDMRHIFTDLLTMTISNGKVYSTEEIDTFSINNTLGTVTKLIIRLAG